MAQAEQIWVMRFRSNQKPIEKRLNPSTRSFAAVWAAYRRPSESSSGCHGMGMVTPLGVGVEPTWEPCAGRRGCGMTGLTRRFACAFAAQCHHPCSRRTGRPEAALGHCRFAKR